MRKGEGWEECVERGGHGMGDDGKGGAGWGGEWVGSKISLSH